MARKMLKPLKDNPEVIGEIGGYQVVEAERDIQIYLQDIHILKAAPADPTNCAFACALKDTLHSPWAYIWKMWAYIALPDDRGQMVAFRFAVPKRTQELIVEFDKTGSAEPGGYWFKAPPPGSTITARRSRDRKYRQDVREGKRVIPSNTVKRGKLQPAKEFSGVRAGTGKVRYAKK